MRPLLVLLLFSIIHVPALAQNITALYYNGSPESFVTRGHTGTLTPEEGYSFQPTVGPYYGHLPAPEYVSIRVHNSSNSDIWDITVAMPRGSEIVPGTYLNATQYPFGDPAGPRLDFSAAGISASSGKFTIYEVSISDGKLVSFAADFMQYEGMALASWSYGSIRFNSPVPINTIPSVPGKPLTIACTNGGPSILLFGYGYGASCVAGGGVGPYTWAVENLPAGIRSSYSSAYESHKLFIEGYPDSFGPFDYTVFVTDSEGNTASINFTGTSTLPDCVPLGLYLDSGSWYPYYLGPSGSILQLSFVFKSFGCPWTLTSDIPGIRFSPDSGTTRGINSSISTFFTVGPNTGSVPLVGNVYLSENGKVVKNYPITVNSKNCSYSINPQSGQFSAQGGSGTFTVRGIPQECHPFTMNGSPWLTSQDDLFYYEIPPNAGASRSGAFDFGNNYSGEVVSSFDWEQQAGDGTLAMNCYKPGPSKIGSSAARCVAAGGTLPYVWTIIEGNNLGARQEISSGTTQITLGNHAAPGDFQFTVRAADSTFPWPSSVTYTVAGTVPPRDPVFLCSLTNGPSKQDASYTTVCIPSEGTPPYRWSLSDGSLPPGLSLSTLTNGGAIISGNPSSAGDYEYTLQLMDSREPVPRAVTRKFGGTIEPPDGQPSQIRLGCTDSTVYFDVGHPALPLACSVTGGAPPYEWSIHYGSLPTGMFLSSTTGFSTLIQGLPTERVYNGSFNPYIKVMDNSPNPQSRIIRLTLYVRGPDDFSCTSAAGKVGEAYFSSCEGLPQDTWISDGLLPPGLNLTAAGISGVPTTQGTYTFTISAQLGVYPTPANTYTIEIASVPASVTIRTNPPGRSFTADGVVYSSPQTFPWLIGSVHTISAGTQQEIEGTLYVFESWSDGDTGSHAITVAPGSSTFTARFSVQYQLSLSVSPPSGGVVSLSPASTSGFYTPGSSIQINAIANDGYTFSGWSGSITGMTNPATLSLFAPRSVTANFRFIGNSRPSRMPSQDNNRVRKKGDTRSLRD